MLLRQIKNRLTYNDKTGGTNADEVWVAAILLAASLSVSTFVPQMIGYLFIAGVCMFLVGILIITNKFSIVYHRTVLLPLILIWFLFTLTTALDPTRAGILRLGAFTLITGINLFVVPAVVNRTALHNVLAYITAVFVIVGLPTVFIGSYGIAEFMISPWHTTREIFGIVIHTPVSIFNNPNYLSGVAAIGTVAAGAKFVRSRTLLAAGLVGVNALGVILAGGRAALLALVVVGVLYGVYRIFNRTAMAITIFFGILATLMGFAIFFNIIPGPSAIANVDLNNRRTIWTAAYEAVLNRPLIGWGPGKDKMILAEYMGNSDQVWGTHNSYIRMFLIGGILGGGAYLIVTLSTVILGLRNAHSERLFTFLLLMTFLILQLFEGMTIFGLSLLSILGALFIGYVQSSSPTSRRIKFETR